MATSRRDVPRVRVMRTQGHALILSSTADGPFFHILFRPRHPFDGVHMTFTAGSPAGEWTGAVIAGGGA